MSKLFAEIRRRKVFQTFVPYLGVVWLVLQVVSVVTPMINLPPLVNTFIAVLLFAGMPVMLYLSWYFDFTAEGLVAIPDKDSGEIQPFGLVRWLVLIVITLSSGAMGYRYFSVVQVEIAKNKAGLTQTYLADSIAVLPFKDASADQDQDFLAQGLAEEITSLLGRTAGLRVAASSSTRLLSGKGLDPIAIAKRLDVATLLSGSVRKTGDQLKIRVELINASDAKVLWSETFSRKFNDIFAIESEIARSTVNMLQDTYIESGSLVNSASTKSTDAYVIYLKGREQYRKQTTESMKEARKLFEQAIGLDPEYAQAYVALADTIVLLAEGPERFGVLKTDIAAKLAQNYLEKAVIRQPDMPEVYAVLGYIPFMLNQPEDSLSFFAKAIVLNPNLAIAHLWKSQALKDLQRHQESLQEMELAYLLDPLNIAVIHNLGYKYSERRNIERASYYFEQLTSNFPTSPLGYAGLADIAYRQGNYALSLKHWMKTVEISPENDEYKLNVIYCLYSLRLTEKFKQHATDPQFESNVLVLEGNYEALFSLLDFQVESRPDDPWIKLESAFFAMQFGEQAKAVELLLQVDNELADEEKYAMPNCSPAIEIAWALQKSGKQHEATQVIKRCQTELDASRTEKIAEAELDYLAARIYALSNQAEPALAQLATAIKAGWREWWTEYDSLFDEVRQLPEFQNQINIINEDLAKQQIEALSLFED